MWQEPSCPGYSTLGTKDLLTAQSSIAPLPPHCVLSGAEHIDPSKLSQVWLAQSDQHAYTERPDMNHIAAGSLYKAHAHW